MVSTRSSGRAQDHTDIKDENYRKEPRAKASSTKQQKLKQDGSLEADSRKRNQESEQGDKGDEKGSPKKAKRELNDIRVGDRFEPETANGDIKKADPSEKDAQPREGTLEKGQVIFLYRPRIDVEDVEGLADVQKFYILLLPSESPSASQADGPATKAIPNKSNPSGTLTSADEKTQKADQRFMRLLEVGKKRLPSLESHETFWATVTLVGSDLSELRSVLGESSYETKTKGTRTNPACDIVAHGAYELFAPAWSKPSDMRSYLAYALATPVPETLGELQDEFRIKKEGSIIVNVKDPEQPATGYGSFQGLTSGKRPTYPSSLQALFETRKNVPANPPILLDYAGAELLLIGAHEELSNPLGDKEAKDLEHSASKIESDTEAASQAHNTSVSEEVLSLIRAQASEVSIEGLQNHWR